MAKWLGHLAVEALSQALSQLLSQLKKNNKICCEKLSQDEWVINKALTDVLVFIIKHYQEATQYKCLLCITVNH